MKKEYECICGKKFDNPQSFNGHKSHCKKHQLNKYGSLQKLEDVDKHRHLKAKETLKLKYNKLKSIKNKAMIDKWLEEKHTCENCHKVMTVKYGSGRFCCRSCANKRIHSKSTIDKIRKYSKNNPSGFASVEWRLNNPDFSLNRKSSKREVEIVNLLKSNFPDDNWQQGYINNGVVDNHLLHPDIHSDVLKIVVEYDGIWHFKDICGQLERRQATDKLLMNWCETNGYKLVRIDEQLNLSDIEILDFIYNSTNKIEFCGSDRYRYLLE